MVVEGWLPATIKLPALERETIVVTVGNGIADLPHSFTMRQPDPCGLAIRWFMLRVIGRTSVIESESVNTAILHLYKVNDLAGFFKLNKNFFSERSHEQPVSHDTKDREHYRRYVEGQNVFHPDEQPKILVLIHAYSIPYIAIYRSRFLVPYVYQLELCPTRIKLLKEGLIKILGLLLKLGLP